MSILSFFADAQRLTIESYNASDLRRALRPLAPGYTKVFSAEEKAAGYQVGEDRLHEIRNLAAFAAIRNEPDYRERILDVITRYIAEAATVLRKHDAVRSRDQLGPYPVRGVAPLSPARLGYREMHSMNRFARIPAAGWTDTETSAHL